MSHDVPTEDRSTGMDEQGTSPGNQVTDDSADKARLRGGRVPRYLSGPGWSWMVLDGPGWSWASNTTLD